MVKNIGEVSKKNPSACCDRHLPYSGGQGWKMIGTFLHTESRDKE